MAYSFSHNTNEVRVLKSPVKGPQPNVQLAAHRMEASHPEGQTRGTIPAGPASIFLKVGTNCKKKGFQVDQNLLHLDLLALQLYH
jgi:hypothetical protein